MQKIWKYTRSRFIYELGLTTIRAFSMVVWAGQITITNSSFHMSVPISSGILCLE